MKEDCQQLIERVSAYLDGEVEGQDLAELLHHLEECRCCQHCLATLRATRELLRKMPAPQLPDDLKARLKACLKESKSS